MKKTLFFAGPGLLLFTTFFGVHNPGDRYISLSGKIIPPSGDSSDGKTCMDCHAALFEKKIKHPLKEGNGCNDCHKSNGSEHPKTGVIGFSPVDKVPGLCLACHEETKNNIASYPVMHKALNDNKSCTYCHTPHSSAEKKLLISKSKELCFSCHNKPMRVTTGAFTKTLINIEQLNNNSKVFHPPFKKCGPSCHNPHGSDSPYLLTRSYPIGEYAPANKDSFALCFECHDPEAIENPTTTTATNFRNGDKNMHYQHIKGEKGRKCTLCHSPHATINPYLIRDEASFGKFIFKLNFIADSAGGSCLPACHEEKKYNRLILNPDSVPNFGK